MIGTKRGRGPDPEQHKLYLSIIKDLRERNRRLRQELRSRDVDPLTGLLTRRGGERALRAEANRLVRARHSNTKQEHRHHYRKGTEYLSVVFLDGDGIKRINDTYGHAAGDRVLKGIAAAITDSKRAYDTAYRYGGDEFIVVLPRTGKIGAMDFIDRVSMHITSSGTHLMRRFGAGMPDISVSGGSHTVSSNDVPSVDAAVKQLLQMADAAMYRKKAKRKREEKRKRKK